MSDLSEDLLRKGGPAFPSQSATAYIHGMSLRDWFAGQALSGLYADHTQEISAETAAEAAYRTADAMLAERNKGTK